MLTMSSVRDYLAENGRASLEDIAVHFDSSPEAARQVLDHWLAKGRVRRFEQGGGCGKASSSCSCASKPQEIYEWTSV
ncbi:FeoC-like transcriptional regulator [Magnetospirillum fulvum]|jgi:DeoR/GlpR family transcriptional regulator of sugar metabolism|uniref:FeoC like transcriptional regulator n=1 Tax=Magnetospirillum fulvum TaxID=1082 RepID=A0A1H6HYL4_MAGFU|nr:FeoC-like transcriptional regulator [Magnetospirillum fulvum]SEH40191.1 FeoC like transcriptional regulator [Magnetospirillum fulvum]